MVRRGWSTAQQQCEHIAYHFKRLASYQSSATYRACYHSQTVFNQSSATYQCYQPE